MVGKTVSHYRIIEKLASGGMGDVYVAENIHLKSRVALKFLPPQQSRDEEAKRRFVQEAQSASALNHPNVCTIHDIDEDDEGQLFIAMALYEGQTLKEKLEDGPLPVEEAADIARQVAEGLAAAHEKDVIHRDIKPANIFMAERGRAVILDFGLAKLQESTAVLTQSGSTLGTVAYMSPEQARGEAVDHRTDIWSLGVVLFEMLTGRRPYEAEYQQALIYKILNEQPGALPPEVSDAATIVSSCMEKVAAERIPDAAALAGQLRAIASSTTGSVEIPRTPAGQATIRWVVSTAVLVVAIGAALFLSRSGVWDDDESLVRQGLAVFPFSVSGDPELEFMGDGMAHALSTALDGAGDLRSIDPYMVIGEVNRSGSAVRDPVAAEPLVSRLGAGTFVLGRVMRIGQRIELQATHYDSEGNVLAREEEVAASEDELTEGTRRLALKLVADHLDPGDQGRVSVTAYTTSSLSALKFYVEGERALRDARFQDAETALARAVEIDSTFALAWHRLGDARGWLTSPNHPSVTAARAEAVKYASTLPQRLRRHVEARRLWDDGDFVAAERAYLTLAKDYPRDGHAWAKLGDVQWHIGRLFGHSPFSADRALEKAIALDPENSEALAHLIHNAIIERQFDRADSLSSAVKNEVERLHYDYSSELARAENRATRDSIIERMSESSLGDVSTVALIARWTGPLGPFAPRGEELETSERLLSSIAERAEIPETGRRARRRQALEMRLLRTGRWSETSKLMLQPDPTWPNAEIVTLWFVAVSPMGAVLADRLDEIRQSLRSTYPSNPEPWTGRFEDQEAVFRAFMIGSLSIKMRDWPEVRRQMEWLQKRVDEGDSAGLARGFAETLQSFVEWQEGDVQRAKQLAENLTVPVSNFGSWHRGRTLNRQLLAGILFVEGDYDRALALWESLAASHSIYIVPSYLYRAQCYEGLGDIDRAIGFYQLFADLWKDADPELQPMVDEARAGLERLLDEQVREPS